MSVILLAMAFLFTGISAIANKALIEWHLKAYNDTYILALYAVPAILGLLLYRVTPQKTTRTDISLGMIMGCFGTLGLITFMIALAHIKGIIAFPVRSLGNLVLTAVVSIIAWHDKLSRSQWIGIALSLAAIWLLSAK